MIDQTESVILCEGFHDRAFWKGWLELLGCSDARSTSGIGNVRGVRDPWNAELGKGDFAFISKSSSFLRVRPCHGDSKVLRMVRERLELSTTHSLRRLVVNVDTDVNDTDDLALKAVDLHQKVAHRVANFDRAFVRLPAGDLSIAGGATIVSVILWAAHDPPSPHLPVKQTLERLVCAALRAAYPERAAAVAAWLAGRPGGPSAGHKEHAWSHMAGWYGESGCDDFYHAVWRDPAVAAQLETRLRQSDAWRVVEELTR